MAASRCSSTGVGRYGDGDGDGDRSHANFFRIRDDVDEHRLRRPAPPSDGARRGDGDTPNPAGSGGAGREAAP